MSIIIVKLFKANVSRIMNACTSILILYGDHEQTVSDVKKIVESSQLRT